MTDDELDSLDRTAVEAMGWTQLGQATHAGCILAGRPPGGRMRQQAPRPTRDHGDCMRLLLHTLAQDGVYRCALASYKNPPLAEAIMMLLYRGRGSEPLVAFAQAYAAYRRAQEPKP